MHWTSAQQCSDLVYALVYPQIFDAHKRRSDEAQAATLERGKERLGLAEGTNEAAEPADLRETMRGLGVLDKPDIYFLDH